MKIIITNKKTGGTIEWNNATVIKDNFPVDFKIESDKVFPRCYSYSLYDWDRVKENSLPTLPEATCYINNLIEEAKTSCSDIVDNVEVKYLKVLADNLEF